MAEEIFLQHWIFTRFALPFLLVFVLVFALLEKTQLFGEGKKQINAIIAFVIGALFVSVMSPTLVVGNLVLFLTVALVVIFVLLLIWGFISGGENKMPFLDKPVFKWVMLGVVLFAVAIAVLWATGIQGDVLGFLFQQEFSRTLWLNVIFGVIIAAALAVMLRSAGSGSSGGG